MYREFFFTLCFGKIATEAFFKILLPLNVRIYAASQDDILYNFPKKIEQFNFLCYNKCKSHMKGMTQMKVILVNGSPHEKGCTYTALSEAAEAMKNNGIEAEIFWVGSNPVSGCIGCGYCRKSGRCVCDDRVNEFTEKAKSADGFIFGTPVHYAGASGFLTSFMDRIFYSAGSVFGGKPAAAVASCRRGGASAALDQINKYFGICGMPTVPSQYWNMVHGNTPDEVRQDGEGMQTMRTLGNNMAWLLKCIESGKQNGIAYPTREAGIKTNFIR